MVNQLNTGIFGKSAVSPELVPPVTMPRIRVSPPTWTRLVGCRSPGPVPNRSHWAWDWGGRLPPGSSPRSLVRLRPSRHQRRTAPWTEARRPKTTNTSMLRLRRSCSICSSGAPRTPSISLGANGQGQQDSRRARRWRGRHPRLPQAHRGGLLPSVHRQRHRPSPLWTGGGDSPPLTTPTATPLRDRKDP